MVFEQRIYAIRQWFYYSFPRVHRQKIMTIWRRENHITSRPAWRWWSPDTALLDDNTNAAFASVILISRVGLFRSRLRTLGTHYHPTLDPAVLWTPSNDTSRPIFSDTLNLTPPAPLYLRTLWRYTNNNNNNNNDTYIAQIRGCSKCANSRQRQTEMFSVCCYYYYYY